MSWNVSRIRHSQEDTCHLTSFPTLLQTLHNISSFFRMVPCMLSIRLMSCFHVMFLAHETFISCELLPDFHRKLRCSHNFCIFAPIMEILFPVVSLNELGFYHYYELHPCDKQTFKNETSRITQYESMKPNSYLPLKMLSIKRHAVKTVLFPCMSFLTLSHHISQSFP